MRSIYRCVWITSTICMAQYSHAELYRWVDEAGHVQYSDKNPGTTKSGTTVMTPRGTLIKKTDGVLTPEEKLQREQDAKAKREQDRQKEEAFLRDKALVSSFDSTTEIDRKRDRNLQQIQGDINSLRSRFKSTEARLNAYHTQSAMLQKSGKPVPEDLNKDIKDTEVDLLATKRALDGKLADKQRIIAQAEADKKRFLELTQDPAKTAATTPSK